MKMSNKVYDVLKYVLIVGVPALILFLNTLGDIWGIPYIGQITATIAALGTFGGSLLQISSAKYNKNN